MTKRTFARNDCAQQAKLTDKFIHSANSARRPSIPVDRPPIARLSPVGAIGISNGISNRAEGAPIAYATTDGVVEPRWGHLIDYTYDGLRQRGQLTGGLGQLVDGVKGPDNFSFNNGFEWVGWKSMNGDVVIEFTFKTLRNFTGALFHSNNLFSSGVEVFQAVDVHYGVDVPLSLEALRDALAERRRRDAGPHQDQWAGAGAEAGLGQPGQTLWSADVLSIEYEPDKKAESSRPVTVHLKQRLANKLRFVLKFASKWILVSEVEFLSHPVELLSLASLSEQLSPPLMAALAPAKTYDEYVAILREHQLRRIATDAYLESFGAGATTMGARAPNDQPDGFGPDRQPAADGPGDLLFGAGADPFAKRVAGPAIGVAPPSLLFPASGQPPIIQDYPATNAQFNPSLGAGYPGPALSSNQQQQEPALAKEQAPPLAPDQQRRPAGLATLTSLALLAILLVLAFLFGLSSYKLRQQPKLRPSAQLAHQWCSPAKGFMSNVLAHSATLAHQQQHHHHQHPAARAGQMQRPMLGQGSSTAGSADSHYNPLFASSAPTSGRSSEASLRTGPISTLRRLATLATNKTNKNANLSPGPGRPHQHQHQQYQSNQLLVSLKDSISSGKSAGHHSQAVNTQLILGLNQANPLAQQQVYNANQTYATHYSTSMSLASGGGSSTTTNGGPQADYSGADYAIPDAAGPAWVAPHQHHLAAALGGAFKHPLQGGATGLRASARLGQALAAAPPAHQHQHQHQHPHPHPHQQTLAEHNYELIYSSDASPAQVAPVPRTQAPPTIHQRTLSGQSGAPPGAPSCHLFGAMTLRNEPLIAQRARHQHQLEGSAAGQTTSADSSARGSPRSGAAGELGAPAAHYYASGEPAAAGHQLDNK